MYIVDPVIIYKPANLKSFQYLWKIFWLSISLAQGMVKTVYYVEDQNISSSKKRSSKNFGFKVQAIIVTEMLIYCQQYNKDDIKVRARIKGKKSCCNGHGL